MNGLVDLTVPNDNHMVLSTSYAIGEYCNIPLVYSSIYHTGDINQLLTIIKSRFGALGQRLDIAYTYGHYGEEAHKWYVVGYELYERLDGMESEIRLMFAPVYPDMFPNETAMTESNLHDCFYPDIYNRILSDRGKLPPL